MTHMLIVEDQPTDVRIAAEIAESLGYAVDARGSSSAAMLYLERAIDGERTVRNVILPDLDLGYESGYELLRFWHSSPALSGTRVVVWTVMGKEQQEVCKLFGVNAVVPKWEGAAALKRELASLSAKAS